MYTYIYVDRIYRYNSNASYKPNWGRYLQLMSAKDLYIQNITVSEHDNHSDSFQVKFPNVVTNYMNRGMRHEDQKIGIIINLLYGKCLSLSFLLVLLVVYLPNI